MLDSAARLHQYSGLNSEGIIAVCLAQNCAIEAMTQDIDWEQILNYDKLFRVTSYIHIEVPLKTASKSLPDPEASALESDKGGREGRKVAQLSCPSRRPPRPSLSLQPLSERGRSWLPSQASCSRLGSSAPQTIRKKVRKSCIWGRERNPGAKEERYH